ncbi:hypothetical protein GGS23DRAFT_597781 [Durotheca rogersii]|uniref:uncharacterized protein n=1 Tax=Durotheca rogersii TaxID=419775 RepID=UPI0022208FA9|nr:uncharacterized protein GGS23DRAFT_597781 [Durotheca rogersii]KAI5862162.1 hypothetical protein GGS23DRAFT_597781 [Durotheca rogersii]
MAQHSWRDSDASTETRQGSPPPPYSEYPPYHETGPDERTPLFGTGPAGISAARHLQSSKAAQRIRLDITLFDSAPLVGGQLALNASNGGQVFPYDDPFQDPIIAEDVTGTALMWGNPLFTRASEETLGDEVRFSELSSQEIGYFSGGIFSQTIRPYVTTPFWTFVGLVFRYGFSVWRAGDMIKETNIRDRIANAPVNIDITQVMISIDLMGSIKQSAQEALDGRGIGYPYITDVLGPQVERVHSQKISDISALAMMLAAAQEDVASFYTGGELISRLDQILAATDATVRTGVEVSGIRYAQVGEQNATWLVEYDTRTSPQPRAETFDKVILAAPRLDLYRAAAHRQDLEAASILAYRPVDVAFFTVPTRINPDVFGSYNQLLFLEEQNGEDEYPAIREMAFLREVVSVGNDGDTRVEYLYRVLSDADATERLRKLDLGITWQYRTRLQHGHPVVYPTDRFPPFQLSPRGLWWTSAIHSVASTIDLSWLAGQIVAEDVLRDLTAGKKGPKTMTEEEEQEEGWEGEGKLPA